MTDKLGFFILYTVLSVLLFIFVSTTVGTVMLAGYAGLLLTVSIVKEVEKNR